MEQPRRNQPSREARLAPSTLPSTSLSKHATIDDVPEVLERSMLRLSDVKQSADGISGPGILVKLFPISGRTIRSVGDSNRKLWIVGSPDATDWTRSKLEAAHKANAKAKASHAAKTGSGSKLSVKAKVTGDKAGRQNEQRSLAKSERNVAEQRVQEGS